MARTQSADYDKKREAITGQAAKLFALRGFAGASVAELAAECDVSKSLIYHYYSSKEAILFDVMSDHIEALHVLVAEHTGRRGSSSTETLKALTRDLLRLYAGAADRQKVLLYELASLPPAQRGEIVRRQREIIEGVESLLVKSVPAASRNKAELRAKVMLFFGMLNWTHTWFKSGGAVSRDELSDMASEMLLRAA